MTWGQYLLGRSPLSAQTATLLTPGGGTGGATASSDRSRFRASRVRSSAIRKNSGAAASTPTNLGFPRASKSPIQTTRTYGPTIPADQASRNPHDVPVFQAIGQRP